MSTTYHYRLFVLPYQIDFSVPKAEALEKNQHASQVGCSLDLVPPNGDIKRHGKLDHSAISIIKSTDGNNRLQIDKEGKLEIDAL